MSLILDAATVAARLLICRVRQARLARRQAVLDVQLGRLDARLAEAALFEAELSAVAEAEKAPRVREWLTARGLL
jgi:hypothetical protein